MKKIKILLILALTLILFSCQTTEPAGPRSVVYRADGNKVVYEITAKESTKEEEYTLSEESTLSEEKHAEEFKEEEYVLPQEAIETTKENKEELSQIAALPKEDIDAEKNEHASASPIDKGDMGDIVNGFNYAYGVRNMKELKSGSVSIIASYFALGLYDASLSSSPRFLSFSEIQSTMNRYIEEYYNKGISFEPGERPLTLEALLSLPQPEELRALFSYAYGYSIVSDLLSGGVDVRIMPFMSGMLDCLYSDNPPLSDAEIQNALNLYIMYLNEEYYQSLEEKKEENRKKAEAFLEKNRKEGVTTLSDGVQIMVLDEDDTLGPTPTQYDTVLMDYNEYILDYDTGELEMTDSEFGVEKALINVSPALQSTVTSMKVGQAVRAFIPPELSPFDETKSDEREPYSIVVYDIALNGIL